MGAAIIANLLSHREIVRDTGLLLKAVITPGQKTDEGRLVEAVSLAWFEIVALVRRDRQAIHQLDWRKWEEMIAGAYKEQGFEIVTLTPRSGDQGRDVIAVSKTLGSIRFLEQVKAYAPDRLVSADEVRSMLGVLSADRNASKGLITTTSDFAPGVRESPQIQPFCPNRLELRGCDQLVEWLDSVARGRGA